MVQAAMEANGIAVIIATVLTGIVAAALAERTRRKPERIRVSNVRSGRR